MIKAIKLLVMVLLIFTIAFSVATLVSCDSSTVHGTDGLAYKLNSDGQSYSAVGMGDAKDKDIVIASKYNELPVTAIADSAFSEYSFLTSVTIPNGVEKIGANAFANCTGLVSIVIPDSVTEIGETAFEGCSGLTSVTIGEGVVSVGNLVFQGCEELTTVFWNAVDCLESGSYDYGSVFYGCYKLSKVEFGQKVKSIPSYLLISCGGITSISLPDSVTTIGEYAFSYCRGLAEITIPGNITEIGDAAFRGCYSLATVYWNATACTKVGSYSSGYYGDQTIFKDCSKLDKIIIGDNVTAIPSYTFYNCNNLTSVYYAGDIADWCKISFGSSSANPLSNGANLYVDNELVTELVIPDTVLEIKPYAFYGLTSIINVIIPRSVTSIGYYAFNGCDNLTSITVPDSVTSIGFWAFDFGNTTNVNYMGDVADWCSIDFGAGYVDMYYCPNFNLYVDNNLVTELVIPKTVAKINSYAFTGCISIESVIISDGVTTIGDYAFYNCSSLKSIVIPDSVTAIGESAFYNCIIETATIPTLALSFITTPVLQTVVLTSGSSIDNVALYDCWNLTSITIPESVVSINCCLLDNCPSSIYYTGDVAGWCKISFVDYDNIMYSCPHDLYIDNELVTDLVIPDTVTEIMPYAFYDCSSIITVTISSSVTTIGEGAFLHCKNITEIKFNGTVEQWKLVIKDSDWNNYGPGTKVICTGGEEAL